MTHYEYAWKHPGDPVEMAKQVREAEATFVALSEKAGPGYSPEVTRADEIALGRAEEFIRVFKNPPRVYLND
ncbi:hypothetical protein [Streptomyces sp. NBC_01233]|uniref:hypothetical protein n=1 Tax=Streptomyces sp. NBC_01233 TaxID=2903787 RepID=UPI002E1427B3|nr:hypothetical protein OG332_47615 [Streptomyces sp. NBC_01233]